MQPHSVGFSLTLVPKRKKILEQGCSRQVWTLRLRSRPPLTQGLRVLLQMRIIWKIGAVNLFKRNMAEKDICCAQVSFPGL